MLREVAKWLERSGAVGGRLVEIDNLAHVDPVILAVHIHHVRERQIASRGVRHEGPDLIDALLYVKFVAGGKHDDRFRVGHELTLSPGGPHG